MEIDPRCFEVDPEKEPYLVNGVYQALDKKDLAEMEKKANALIAKSIKFSFDPPWQKNLFSPIAIPRWPINRLIRRIKRQLFCRLIGNLKSL